MKILVWATTSLFVLLHGCARDNASTEMLDKGHVFDRPDTTSSNGAFQSCAKTTQAVLITHCGSCHQSTLDTHKPGAIAVFDLDQGQDWHNRLLVDHLEGIAKRTLEKTTITEEQKEAIKEFVHLKRLDLESK